MTENSASQPSTPWTKTRLAIWVLALAVGLIAGQAAELVMRAYFVEWPREAISAGISFGAAMAILDWRRDRTHWAVAVAWGVFAGTFFAVGTTLLHRVW